MALIAISKAAERLGCCVQTIHNYCNRGLIRMVRIPGTTRDTLRVEGVDVERVYHERTRPAMVITSSPTS